MNLLGWIRKECALRRADRCARRGNLEKALDQIQLAKSAAPNDPNVQIQHAWVLGELKRYAEALTGVEEALKTHPNHAILHMVRGELLYHTGDYEKAKSTLHVALELSGENLRIEYALGLVYVALGEMDRAAHFFEGSVRYDKELVQSRLLAMAERYLFDHRAPAP